MLYYHPRTGIVFPRLKLYHRVSHPTLLESSNEGCACQPDSGPNSPGTTAIPSDVPRPDVACTYNEERLRPQWTPSMHRQPCKHVSLKILFESGSLTYLLVDDAYTVQI